jgi:uncharacterized protein
MTTNAFTQFISFIEEDRFLRIAQENYKQAEIQAKALQAQFADEHDRMAALKSYTHNLHKQMLFYELESKSQRTRQDEIRNKLVFVENPKEYTALHKELEELERSNQKCEDQLFNAWQAYEAAQVDYEKKLLKFQDLKREHELSLNNAHAELKRLSQEIETHERQRAYLEKNVNPELLQEYRTMRLSVDNPVVPVENNHCSACYYHIAQQDLARLRHHILVPCKECYRKLYLI